MTTPTLTPIKVDGPFTKEIPSVPGEYVVRFVATTKILVTESMLKSPVWPWPPTAEFFGPLEEEKTP